MPPRILILDYPRPPGHAKQSSIMRTGWRFWKGFMLVCIVFNEPNEQWIIGAFLMIC